MSGVRQRRHWVLISLVVLSCSLLTVACRGGDDAPDIAASTPASAPELPAVTATATTVRSVTASPTQVASPATATTVEPTSTSRPTEQAQATTPATAVPPVPPATADVPSSTPDNEGASGPVIVLDPGHDHTTPGALGIEYQVVLHAANIAKEALEAAGYQVYLTRSDNQMSFFDDPSLLPPNAADMHPGYGRAYAHASKALQFDPDMVIVLHFNGHPNPDVGGIEVYYCEMGGPQNLELAYIMRNELLSALRSIGYEPPATRVAEDLGVARGNRHFPSLGNVYTSDNVFVENRYAGIPVVLTEPLYMTNADEYALIQDDATHVAIADAYVRAANAWFGR